MRSGTIAGDANDFDDIDVTTPVPTGDGLDAADRWPSIDSYAGLVQFVQQRAEHDRGQWAQLGVALERVTIDVAADRLETWLAARLGV